MLHPPHAPRTLRFLAALLIAVGFLAASLWPAAAARAQQPDSSNVQLVGTFSVNSENGAFGVAVSGSYAYLIDDGTLRVVDVSDPANPQEVGVLDTNGNYGLLVEVKGSYAYIEVSSKLFVIDISDPTNPQEVGFLDLDPTHMIEDMDVSGNYVLTLRRIEVSFRTPIRNLRRNGVQ